MHEFIAKVQFQESTTFTRVDIQSLISDPIGKGKTSWFHLLWVYNIYDGTYTIHTFITFEAEVLDTYQLKRDPSIVS